MKSKVHVRRGDTVEVVSGAGRGARGRIIRVLPQKNKVVVEGVNMVWKHLKPNRQNPRGGRLEMEAPIDASNVMLVCQNRECARFDRPVRSRTRVNDDGTKVRCCSKCESELPKME